MRQTLVCGTRSPRIACVGGMVRGGKVHVILHKCACLWRTIGFSRHFSELFLTFCIVVSYYWLHLQNKITTRIVNCKASA